jgi:hypothetical protein
MAIGFLIVGFLLAVTGVALYSIRLALIVAGLVLFISGGLELRLQAPRRRPS